MSNPTHIPVFIHPEMPDEDLPTLAMFKLAEVAPTSNGGGVSVTWTPRVPIMVADTHTWDACVLICTPIEAA